MVGRALGLAPEAALEDWGLPCEGRVWGQCLGRRGSGRTGYAGESAAKEAGNINFRRLWQLVLANTLPNSCLEMPPLPNREAWQATGYKVAKSRT